MKEYTTYIFDLDGTLLDTLDDLAASTNYALHQHGMPQHSRDEVRMFVGNGVGRLIARAVPENTPVETYEQVLQTFREHYLVHGLDRTKPYPGIMPLLRDLKQRGKLIAVVSNKFYAATQELCTHFFGPLVDVAIGEREDIRRKPAPDTVNEALRQLHADRASAVYIGDSDVDIATARNSAMPCISVLWGFRDRQFLMDNGATCLVSSPQEILP
jgi:phosphoglycolate phosphatase